MSLYEIVTTVLSLVGIAVIVCSILRVNRNIDRYNNKVLPTLMRRVKEAEDEMNRLTNGTYHDMELKAEYLKQAIEQLKNDLDNVRSRVGVLEERLDKIESLEL
jgi:predicted  nucleic acid-binding Zn-ribbon protein